ncbi:hypothetical protein AO263_20235 [Pseudomonas sp. NZIPFR-PS5]|nr:hypothetical protein AO263_20235 [Pseudomonas sp. NZIPFR-PS5]
MQCLWLQLPGSVGEVKEVTQLAGETTDGFNAMGVCLAGNVLQCGEQAFHRVTIIADQFQMAEAFIGAAHECLGIAEKLCMQLLPFIAVQHVQSPLFSNGDVRSRGASGPKLMLKALESL